MGVRDIFGKMGFQDQEIVALIGAHTVGRCHPEASGYDGPWTLTPTTFNNLFFKLLKDNTWVKTTVNSTNKIQFNSSKLMMLPADMALLKDEKFKKYVSN